MIRRPPRSTLSSSSAASDVYKRQVSTQSTGDLETNTMAHVHDNQNDSSEPAAWGRAHSDRPHDAPIRRDLHYSSPTQSQGLPEQPTFPPEYHHQHQMQAFRNVGYAHMGSAPMAPTAYQPQMSPGYTQGYPQACPPGYYMPPAAPMMVNQQMQGGYPPYSQPRTMWGAAPGDEWYQSEAPGPVHNPPQVVSLRTYVCLYCERQKSSDASDKGPVWIRCECGAEFRDGHTRLHSRHVMP
eukprot:TRINITY_DN1857_c0_g1_i2.p1 TRINITY_DN1857_c0_g1~~TRINITY_DN1857_c0_g1_i2.p1  ORF type:complete len:239 (-),score=13.05 TRINITY_DN1857_c0_g1_i2:298-1014(-)